MWAEAARVFVFFGHRVKQGGNLSAIAECFAKTQWTEETCSVFRYISIVAQRGPDTVYLLCCIISLDTYVHMCRDQACNNAQFHQSRNRLEHAINPFYNVYCYFIVSWWSGLHNQRCGVSHPGLPATRSVCPHHLAAQTMAAYPSLPSPSLAVRRSSVYFSSLRNDAGTKIPAPVIPPS